MTTVFRPFHLFTFAFSSGTLRFTDTDRTLVVSANTYLAVPIVMEKQQRGRSAPEESLRLHAQSVDRSIAALILGEDVQGKSCVVHRLFWTDPTTYTAPIIAFDGQVDGITIREDMDSATVSFDIRNDFALWQRPVPSTSFSPTCEWIFKTTSQDGYSGCGYTGVASLCNKTWERCVELANSARFRGFRHLPSYEGKEIWWGRAPYQNYRGD